MVSFIASSTSRHLIFPFVSSLGLGTNFKISPRISFSLVKKDRSFGCKELKETRTRSGFSCEGYLDSEAELALERELLEFMKNSGSPNDFPTKKQLLDAGRVDIVNAITKTGGWLALGWDYSDDDNDFDDFGELQTSIEGFQQRHDVYDLSSASSSLSHHYASTSGRSSEMLAEEDTGVEGILSRLEKHRRSLSFDVGVVKNVYGTYASSNMSTDVAGEIDYGIEESKKDRTLAGIQEEDDDDSSQAQGRQVRYNNMIMEEKDETMIMIRFRLKQMQLQLSSALHSLRSKIQTQVHESCGSELQQLSDVLEFQENEVMKAKDKLRSIRAKLAVFEGKIALSVMDTQKLVREKQRRIDSARTALKLLRNTCIFWTHSASQVLLVGSFDGWTSQVRMEKTTTGIFSVSLKLYPGRYEIKFIVDGIWRVDPMLPVVHSNGFKSHTSLHRFFRSRRRLFPSLHINVFCFKPMLLQSSIESFPVHACRRLHLLPPHPSIGDDLTEDNKRRLQPPTNLRG